MQRSVVLAFGLVGWTLAVAGCGSSFTSASGKVTYKGKTVVWGNVSVVASDGVPYSCQIQEDGTFTLPKVPTGPCKIGVVSQNPDANQELKLDKTAFGTRLKGNEGPKKPSPGQWFAIPEKYMDPVTSGLTGDIKRGAPLNVELP